MMSFNKHDYVKFYEKAHNQFEEAFIWEKVNLF